jgi:hypothetical protein
MKNLMIMSLMLVSILSVKANAINPTPIHDAQPPREGYVPEASTQTDSGEKAKEDSACEAAYKKSIDSGVIADAIDAAEVCKAAVDAACVRTKNKTTGDARLAAAVCRLKAAHGAYLNVQESK